ncbi:MAG: pilus assembly protein CpaC [Phycisphaerales bacterium]|jgi:pilus assembly protein CpaC|nr:pilus assembly protein CpaC [Phycisphaerales bacterium]
MIQMKRNARRTLRKLSLAIGAGAAMALFVAAATPVAGQAPRSVTGTDTTTTTATTPVQRANRLVAEGVEQDGRVRLMVNKTTVITTPQPFKQVSVGNPEVADVTIVGPNNVLVTGKRQGSTQLIIWDDNNRSQVADVIVGMDLEALQSDLSATFGNVKVQATSMNGAIGLRGQVRDLKTAESMVAMAQQYSPRVLNMLEIAGGQQVMLQVRFAEVSRRATNALGVNFATSDGIFGIGSNIGQNAPSGFAATPGDANFPGPMTTNTGAGVTLFGGGAAGNAAFRYFVQALRQNNLLRILAEPNLVAMSGQEASFLAGGEFPVPVPQSGVGGGGTITVEYREFGVRLNMVPLVLGDGRIRLKLNPEVSDLDFSSPLVIQGSRIPIVNKRTVSTTIELADGQSFAIAGLLDHSVNATKDVTPLLGDIPVLGALFRSVRYERRETELVVLVTPKLVEAMDPNQVPPLPGETWRHPNELDLFLNQDIGSESAVKPDGGDMTPATGHGRTAAAGAVPNRYHGAYGFTPPPEQQPSRSQTSQQPQRSASTGGPE